MNREKLLELIETELRLAVDDEQVLYQLDKKLFDLFQQRLIDDFLIHIVIVDDHDRLAVVCVVGYGWFEVDVSITPEQDVANYLRYERFYGEELCSAL